MLRWLVLLLVLANAVWFGWTHGWFAPGWLPPRHAESEPERLAAQVRPDAVTVLPPRAASAAVSAARAAAAVCLEAGPLADSEGAAAQAALAEAQLPDGSVTREPPALPGWLVATSRIADPAARRAREAELRRANLAVEPIDAPADLAPALVVSRHATRSAAEAALAALANQPAARGLRVLSLPPGNAPHWLRVARADAEVQQRLLALPAAALAGGFRPCGRP